LKLEHYRLKLEDLEEELSISDKLVFQLADTNTDMTSFAEDDIKTVGGQFFISSFELLIKFSFVRRFYLNDKISVFF